MLWLWDRMVFFSFGICVPIDVVLWYISLLWKLPSKGSKGACRTCCCCNCCNGVFCRVDGHSSLFFPILGLVIRFQVFTFSKQNRFKFLACAM
ncbi:hypothetical protein NC653_016682 [Populus alba x Populus x berolinensis]|uniref:Uncharacterized protein n=1 Tax=Populus alba x Populus x berolinensis TaxID=444605 RepID=A0AAD6W003_9ROSI|nr:hypothetical protein NC653_016682 [Populus alba x Populus x berolinensis]